GGQALALRAADGQAANTALDLIAVGRLILGRCFDVNPVGIDDLYRLAFDLAPFALGIGRLRALAIGGLAGSLGGRDLPRQLFLRRCLRLALAARGLIASRLVPARLFGLLGLSNACLE